MADLCDHWVMAGAFPSDEFVTVARFTNPVEADMARSFLESHGLETFLADEHMGRLGLHYSAIMGGVKLQVRRSDEATARELLASVE